MRRTVGPVLLAATLAVTTLVGCGDDDVAPSSSTGADGTGSDGDGATTTNPSGVPAAPILWSPEGNNLWAYGTVAAESDPPQFPSQLVNTNNDEDPDGWDINGEVCVLPPGDDGVTRIVAGEDTHQPDPPAGWGVFEVAGDAVGDLSVERVARLVPSFPADDEEPDTFGCGVLSDGRVVTTTIGNNAAGDGNGQLVVWYPPFDSPDGSGIEFCVVADDIATAMQIWVDDHDAVYVASGRPPTSGVWRYGPDLPAAPDACAAVAGVQVIVAGDGNPLISPNGVVGGSEGETLFVGSIINGVIAEFDLDGTYIRTVLEPPEGASLLDGPYPTGTPVGLALAADGTLYYADLGLVSPGAGELPGPAPGQGSVRRIVIGPDAVSAPEVIADGLTFPDGLGLWIPA